MITDMTKQMSTNLYDITSELNLILEYLNGSIVPSEDTQVAPAKCLMEDIADNLRTTSIIAEQIKGIKDNIIGGKNER